MKISGTDIYMTRGDSESITVSVSGVSLVSGDFLEMTVRKRFGSPPVFYKKIDSFPAVIPIEPKDTSGLPTGEYVYDMQLTYGGAVKTIVKPSNFVLENEVTYGN